MAERVVGADRDHRQAGLGAVEQAIETGVVAAMVGDLEDVDRAGVERDGLGLGVGGEQHREAAPAGDGHHGELVRVLSRVGSAEALRRRPQNVEPQPP